MKNYLKKWSIVRVIYLLFGLAIVYQGFEAREWMFVILGSIFCLMPLLNLGCCSTAGCRRPLSKYVPEEKETTFEEVK